MKKFLFFVVLFGLVQYFVFSKVIYINQYNFPLDKKFYLEKINDKVYNKLFELSNRFYGKNLNKYKLKLEEFSQKIDSYIKRKLKYNLASLDKKKLDNYVFKLRLYWDVKSIIDLMLKKEAYLGRLKWWTYCIGVDNRVCDKFKNLYLKVVYKIHDNGYLDPFDINILKKVPIYLKLVNYTAGEKGKFFWKERKINVEDKIYMISYPEKIEFYLTKEDIKNLLNNNFDYKYFWSAVIAHEIWHYIEEIKFLRKKNIFNKICWNKNVLVCKENAFIPTTNWFLIKYSGKKVFVGTWKVGNKIYTYYKIYPKKFDYYSMTNPSEDFAEAFAYESFLKKYKNYFSLNFLRKIRKLSKEYYRKVEFLENQNVDY